MRDYELMWHDLKDEIMENIGACACSHSQYIYDEIAYRDSTARMQAYQHILDFMKKSEDIS